MKDKCPFLQDAHKCVKKGVGECIYKNQKKCPFLKKSKTVAKE